MVEFTNEGFDEFGRPQQQGLGLNPEIVSNGLVSRDVMPLRSLFTPPFAAPLLRLLEGLALHIPSRKLVARLLTREGFARGIAC